MDLRLSTRGFLRNTLLPLPDTEYVEFKNLARIGRTFPEYLGLRVEPSVEQVVQHLLPARRTTYQCTEKSIVSCQTNPAIQAFVGSLEKSV